MTNRELDQLIAEKVTGLRVLRDEKEVPLGWYREEGREFLKEPHLVLDAGTWNATFEKHRGIGFKTVPHYSTDLNQAFRVIEKMRDKMVRTNIESEAFAFWHAEMTIDAYGEAHRFRVDDESPARAICLCALKVIEDMEKK